MNPHKHHSGETNSGESQETPRMFGEEQSAATLDQTAASSDHGSTSHGEHRAIKNESSERSGEMRHGSMPGMSAEEHAEMMRRNSGVENQDAMQQNLMSGGHGSMPHQTGEMNHAAHIETMWRESLWASFVNLLLGAWLVASPFTLGYRNAAMTRSDVASGLLIIVFSLLSAKKGLTGNSARWANCFVGLWLLFAPLVFWTPDAAAYANDTLVGALVIAFAVLVTMMPGMDMSVMMDGADVPPGWSYNPSTWLQRVPIILLAAVGFFASRYMAAFQLGHINTIWDPIFGDGTARVLTSDVSKMFPVSDAGLGAAAYVIEILMGFMGDKARWRTMPWMVAFFAILVVPLGVTSIVLVILQPLAVGAWCFLCLLAALAMLVMVPATLDEVIAMLQFMRQARRAGKPFWRTFWLGGTVEGEKDNRLSRFDWSRPQAMFASWLTSNWHLLAAAGIGAWLMFAPDFFGTTGKASDSDRLTGALIVTAALVATAEVARAARLLNFFCAAWLFAAPLALSGFVAGARWNNVAAGVALILLTIPRGRIGGRYGSWQPYIR